MVLPGFGRGTKRSPTNENLLALAVKREPRAKFVIAISSSVPDRLNRAIAYKTKLLSMMAWKAGNIPEVRSIRRLACEKVRKQVIELGRGRCAGYEARHAPPGFSL